MVASSEIGVFNHAIFAGTNGVSVLVCVLAAILVLCLKLYKTFVYRMALYQVLSALAVAFVETMQVVFINYDKSPNSYRHDCIAIGFLVQYTIWVKLLFTCSMGYLSSLLLCGSAQESEEA